MLSEVQFERIRYDLLLLQAQEMIRCDLQNMYQILAEGFKVRNPVVSEWYSKGETGIIVDPGSTKGPALLLQEDGSLHHIQLETSARPLYTHPFQGKTFLREGGRVLQSAYQRLAPLRR